MLKVKVQKLTKSKSKAKLVLPPLIIFNLFIENKNFVVKEKNKNLFAQKKIIYQKTGENAKKFWQIAKNSNFKCRNFFLLFFCLSFSDLKISEKAPYNYVFLTTKFIYHLINEIRFRYHSCISTFKIDLVISKLLGKILRFLNELFNCFTLCK